MSGTGDSTLDFNEFDDVGRTEADGGAAVPQNRPADFGRYHFIGNKELGAGGLGKVWLAEEIGELGTVRLVAVKFLSKDLDRSLVANEVRSQGSLTHPNIATLYDYGVQDKTPWLAMEYVKGKHLDTYCAEKKCSLNERLRLFQMVCDAVAFAHIEKLDHGDLKPSNILVRDDGVVKLLDFGFARRFRGADSPDEKQLVMGLTLRYAAPEQIKGVSSGFRGDIYSLGATLYELLTAKPFRESLGRAEVMAIAAGEKRPEPPSSLKSGELASLPAGGQRDLDAICMKALATDPKERYSSADLLLEDVRRYLRDEPLAARSPHTRGYILQKFVQRNRKPLVAAAVVIVVIAAIVAGYTIRLAKERDSARSSALRAERISDFMQDLLQGGDDEVGPSKDLKVVEMLDRGVPQIAALAAEPKIQADLYLTFGTYYQSLGLFDRAEPLIQHCLKLRRALYKPGHEEIADALLKLGSLRLDEENFSQAEQLVRESLASSEPRLGSAHKQVIQTKIILAQILQQRGANDESMRLLTECTHAMDGQAPSKEYSAALSGLANAYYNRSDFARADELNNQALKMDEQLRGENHPNIADDFNNLGQIQLKAGNYQAAEGYFRRALKVQRNFHGDDHPATAEAAVYVAQALQFEKRLSEARSLVEPALKVLEKKYPANHPRIANAAGVLAAVDRDEGKYSEAEAGFQRQAQIYQTLYRDDRVNTGVAISGLATVALAKQDFVKAEHGFRDAIQHMSKSVKPDDFNIGLARTRLGHALVGQKRFRDAEPELRAGYRIISSKSSNTTDWLKTVRADLLLVYTQLGDRAAAEEFR